MNSTLLQTLMAGAGSSSQFVGGLVVALLYAVLGVLGAIGNILVFRQIFQGRWEQIFWSLVSWASPKSAPIAWGLGGLVAATRIVLLAHWTTDVIAGLVMGALVERCLRPLSETRVRSMRTARGREDRSSPRA
jgi:membrane-associated phospholipid phosphatase